MASLGPRAGLLGVYDHPPPEDGSQISAIELHGNGVAVEGARRLTWLVDRIENQLDEAI